jgi:hypothetical protein
MDDNTAFPVKINFDCQFMSIIVFGYSQMVTEKFTTHKDHFSCQLLVAADTLKKKEVKNVILNIYSEPIKISTQN